MARSRTAHLVKPMQDVMLDATQIWAPQQGPQLLATLCPVKMVLFGGSRGGGKSLPLSAKVLTPKGWSTMGEMQIGGVITNPVNGGSQRVVGVYPQGEMDIYRVGFDDGAVAYCTLDHLWAYKCANRPRPGSKKSEQRAWLQVEHGVEYSVDRFDGLRVGTTKELLTDVGTNTSPRIPLTAPVLYSVNGRSGKNGIDPYLLGLLFGDGTFSNGQRGHMVTTGDQEIADVLAGYGFEPSGDIVCANGVHRSWYLPKANFLSAKLSSLASNHGLIGATGKKKIVPAYILTADVEFRIGFLQGLLDSDGYVDERGHIEFSNISDSIVLAVRDLVRSLGGKATVSDLIVGKYKDSFGETVECQEYRRVYVWLPYPSMAFRLKRKAQRCVKGWNGGYENMRKIVSIELSHREEAQCIKVSSVHGLFVTNDYVVTHNTDCAIGKQIYGALRYGPDWNGLFIRKSYKYFADIRRRLGQLIRAGLPAELVGPQQGTNYLRFKSGANITLTVVESIEKAEFFQGQSFTSVSIEEACQFSYIDAMIEMLKGCLRSASGVPTQMFLTANPGGPGHSQVKSRFMPKGVKPGQIITDDTGMTSVFIPSSVEDNKILCENDPDYVNNLRSIKDPALRKAWLEGDWDVVLGGFFGDVWNPYKHVVPQFRPPAHWPRVVSMDWGSATPFSINWFAIADGETSVPLRGVHHIFPKGAMIQFQEWYGVQKNVVSGRIEANVGIRMQSSDVGARMLDLESRLALLGRTTLVDRVADPSIFAEKDGPSIAEKFCDAGVVWRRGENKRISGWDTMRYMLHGRLKSQTFKDLVLDDGTIERVVDTEEREPLLYFTENCEHIIRTLPEQERDMADWEDVETTGEDHACLTFDTEVFCNGSVQKIGDIINTGGDTLNLYGDREEFAVCKVTSKESEVVRLEFEDGESVRCTPDHKFLTDFGWTRCDTLTAGDELRYVDKNNEEVAAWTRSSMGVSRCLRENGTICAGNTGNEKVSGYIGLSGPVKTDQCQQGSTSITKIKTETTIALKILNLSTQGNISHCTAWSQLASRLQGKTCWKLFRSMRRYGISQKRAAPGIKRIMRKTAGVKRVGANFANVIGARANLRPLSETVRGKIDFAPGDASQRGEGRLELMTRQELALSAVSSSPLTGIQKCVPAERRLAELLQDGTHCKKRIVKIERLEKKEAVACLYVSGSHSFLLASGLISHNCDELRYVATSRPTSGIRLSDIIRPAALSECALDIKMAVEGRGGLRMPDDGMTRPQSAGLGSWDEQIAGVNAYIAK